MVWIQNDRPGIGGRFTVEFEMATVPSGGGSGPRTRFFQLLAPTERETVRAIQNEVIATIPSVHPELLVGFDAWAGVLTPIWRPIDEPYSPREDVWLRYASEADARRWLEWLAPRIVVLAERFERAPDRFDLTR